MYKPKLIIKILGPGEAFTGKAFNYFKSGVMESEGTYLNGKKDGSWTYWHEVFGRDIVESRGNYKNGEPDGLWETFDEDGNLTKTEEYKNGELDGLWEWFDENGQLTKTEMWENGARAEEN